jgi:hypothetical protein
MVTWYAYRLPRTGGQSRTAHALRGTGAYCGYRPRGGWMQGERSKTAPANACARCAAITSAMVEA